MHRRYQIMIGIIYFIVIIFANTIGAISGMGGGVIIKPIFDTLGFHTVAAISFYSSVAVLTMSFVSTGRQLKNGINIDWFLALKISIGSVIGGLLGNLLFEYILTIFPKGREVQLIQIILTIITLLASYIYSKYHLKTFYFQSSLVTICSGLLLGFLASLLGIGGGPINVALLMCLFALPIKDATVYSIIVILFSQLAKIMAILLMLDLTRYDLTLLYFIIPAAIIGGFTGAWVSGKVSEEKVSQIYQWVILLVLLINIYNGWQIL